MNRKFYKVLSMVLALLMCLALVPSAMAEGPTEESTTTTSTSVTIKVNLILNSNAAVPSPLPTFTYKLTGSDEKLDSENVPLFAGITKNVKIGKDVATEEYQDPSFSLTFTNDDPVSGLPKDTNDLTKKHVTEKLVIDFQNVQFTEAGVYRYKLEETYSAPFVLDTEEVATRYIDVLVEYKSLGNGDFADTLSIAALSVFKWQGTGKSDSIDNVYPSYDLTLKKTVSGNQASKSEYFMFKVTVTNPNEPEDAYPTSYTVNTTEGKSHTDPENPKAITAGQKTTFYLKGDESIVIQGLPKGATYIITESDATGYTTTATVNETTKGAATDDGFTVADNNGIEADTTVIINNARNGAIPTGVLLTIAPFAGLMIVGLVGVMVFLKKKHKD